MAASGPDALSMRDEQARRSSVSRPPPREDKSMTNLPSLPPKLGVERKRWGQDVLKERSNGEW